MAAYIEGQDYVLRCVPFPNCAADGAIVKHPDGMPNIYINTRVSTERQISALKHELEHLANDDLYSDEPIWMIEGRMHD